jgi:hypothetical protein
VVLDKRIKTWNFFFWEQGQRRSRKIGAMSQYPTKASAWRAAKPMRDAIENQVSINNTTPTVNKLVEQYRAERMPKRVMTRQGYNTWLNHYIIPTWGNCSLQELQARPVDLWLQSLNLTPKRKVHIRGLVRVLWDFAMWRGDVPLQRNPMELVTIKGASKRIRQTAQPHCGRIPAACSATLKDHSTLSRWSVYVSAFVSANASLCAGRMSIG